MLPVVVVEEVEVEETVVVVEMVGQTTLLQNMTVSLLLLSILNRSVLSSIFSNLFLGLHTLMRSGFRRDCGAYPWIGL